MHARRAGRVALVAGLAAAALGAAPPALPGELEIRLRIAAALAAAALLAGARLAPRASSLRRAAHVAAALLGLLAFYNFGVLRHQNDASFVNVWEHFHYQLGSKYFPELAHDGLYVASIEAQRESAPQLSIADEVRDLRTNELGEARHLESHRAAVRERFTPERWRAFVADHAYYLATLEPVVIAGIRKDHGYNPPPTWTFVARLFDARLPASDAALALLASLDVWLLVATFAVVYRCYGLETTCLGLALLGLAYGWRYAYIGALLRLDWLASLVVGICMLERRRPALAGALFGYSISLRLFPALLLLGPGLLAAKAWLRGERPVWPLRLAAGLAAALALAFLAGGLSGRGFAAWREFERDIALHRLTWPPNRVGLDSLILYGPHVLEGARAAWSEARSLPVGEHKVGSLMQQEIERTFAVRGAARALLRLAFLLAVGAAVWRATPAQAAVLSIGALFAWVPIDNYYWVLLVAVPLAGGAGPTLALLALAAALYASDLLHPGLVTRHVLMALAIGGFWIAWLWIRSGQGRRAASTSR